MLAFDSSRILLPRCKLLKRRSNVEIVLIAVLFLHFLLSLLGQPQNKVRRLLIALTRVQNRVHQTA